MSGAEVNGGDLSAGGEALRGKEGCGADETASGDLKGLRAAGEAIAVEWRRRRFGGGGRVNGGSRMGRGGVLGACFGDVAETVGVLLSCCSSITALSVHSCSKGEGYGKESGAFLVLRTVTVS